MFALFLLLTFSFISTEKFPNKNEINFTQKHTRNTEAKKNTIKKLFDYKIKKTTHTKKNVKNVLNVNKITHERKKLEKFI